MKKTTLCGVVVDGKLVAFNLPIVGREHSMLWVPTVRFAAVSKWRVAPALRLTSLSRNVLLCNGNLDASEIFCGIQKMYVTPRTHSILPDLFPCTPDPLAEKKPGHQRSSRCTRLVQNIIHLQYNSTSTSLPTPRRDHGRSGYFIGPS